MQTLNRFVCLIAFFALLTAAVARAEITHRYSFKDGKADDSVGKVNGKLQGKAKVAGDKLVLDNTGKTSEDTTLSYLSFSERILPKSGSSTIEVWFTATSDGAYSRVFDFGQRGQGYVFLTPDEGSELARTAISSNDFGDETTLRSDEHLNNGKPHMVALVIDAKSKSLKLFVDGKPNGGAEPLEDHTLENVKGNNHWLGRSIFDTDAGFTGSIDELRIFDTALTAAEVAAHYKAGPDALESEKK